MIPIPAHLEPVLAEYAKAQGITVEQLAVAALEREFAPHEGDETTEFGFASKEIEEAWIAEINRRVDDIDNGRTVMLDGEEVLKEMFENLRRRRAAA